jgi:predicted RecB family endonuclease
VDTVATVTAGAYDLGGVKAFLANVVQRVVEETRQLTERLGLEVVLLVLLLAFLGFVFEPVQPVVNGILEVLKPLCNLLLNNVKTGREVGSAQSSTC